MRFRLVEDITPTIAQDIVDEYGTTTNWRETGFILRDGTQVDLSGKRFGARGNSRTVDHREPFEDGTDDLIKFIVQGNIRVLPEYPGINLSIEPTESQYQKIKELVIKLGYTNDYFSIDFDDKNGNTKASKEYSENINVRKILDDIRFYFKNGKLPYESELSLFREDLDIPMSDEYDSEGNQLTKLQAEFFKNSKVRDKSGKLLVCYHGSLAQERFTEFKAEKGFNINAIYFTNNHSVAHHWSKVGTPRLFNREKVERELNSIKESDPKNIEKLLKLLNNKLHYSIELEDGFKSDKYGTMWRISTFNGTSSSPLGYKDPNENNTYFRFSNIRNTSDGWEEYGEKIVINLYDYLIELANNLIHETFEQNGIYNCYLNIVNPLVVDAYKQPYWNIEFEGSYMNTEAIAVIAKERGYDGVIIKDVFETDYEDQLCDDFILFKSNQIKSIDNDTPTSSSKITESSNRYKN